MAKTTDTIQTTTTPVTEVSTSETTQPKTVSLEAYENLYKQALELDARYKRLFVLYNNLLEAYLSQK